VHTTRRPVIAVIGNATVTDPDLIALYERLGAAIVERGWRVASGGLSGVMECVSRGAATSEHAFDGAVIGIVPTYDSSSANPYCDVVIPTGMSVARNVVVASSGDVVVACGGGSGTLSEIAVAWQLGKPVLSLGPGGWGEALRGKSLDQRRDDVVLGFDDVSELMDAIASALEAEPPNAAPITKI